LHAADRHEETPAGIGGNKAQNIIVIFRGQLFSFATVTQIKMVARTFVVALDSQRGRLHLNPHKRLFTKCKHINSVHRAVGRFPTAIHREDGRKSRMLAN